MKSNVRRHGASGSRCHKTCISNDAPIRSVLSRPRPFSVVLGRLARSASATEQGREGGICHALAVPQRTTEPEEEGRDSKKSLFRSSHCERPPSSACRTSPSSALPPTAPPRSTPSKCEVVSHPTVAASESTTVARGGRGSICAQACLPLSRRPAQIPISHRVQRYPPTSNIALCASPAIQHSREATRTCTTTNVGICRHLTPSSSNSIVDSKAMTSKCPHVASIPV